MPVKRLPAPSRPLLGGLLARAGAGLVAESPASPLTTTGHPAAAPPTAVRQAGAVPSAAAATAVPPTLAETAPRGTARAKLWQLDRKFHCLLVGTCVSAPELAKFARRFGFSAPFGDDYAVHVEAVGCCGSRNAVSEALQKHLDRRYRTALAAFTGLRDEGAVLARWNEALAAGDVAGPLWAAVTHKHAGELVRRAAYGAVHMLSHQVGAGLAADVRRLDVLEQDNVRLRLELAALRAENARRADIGDDELRALRQEVAGLREQNDELGRDRARLAELESGVGMIALARRLMALADENRTLKAAAARTDAQAERIDALQRELAACRAETEGLRAERQAIERLLDAGLGATAPAAAGPDAAACAGGPAAADCLRCAEANGLSRERCILCVGGRTSLLPHYRALAERLGIRLIHHDGGQEEALSRLPDLIARADAVLCPTDCVGHAAYYSLKQQCRKSGKPCLLFKGAGVTSFAFALWRLSSGESSLPTAGARRIDGAAPDAARRDGIDRHDRADGLQEKPHPAA